MKQISKSLVIVSMTLAFAGQTFAAQIRILNEDAQPLAGADVLVGKAAGDPYEDNVLKTDFNGYIQISDKWSKPLPLTVNAVGYLKTTFLDVSPNDAALQVHKSDNVTSIQISGDTTSFENVRKDGKVDFGLVYPALKKRQISQFEVESVISSDFDIVKVISEELAVPSNFTLPRQSENYVLPITFDKPTYRMHVKQPGTYRMMATHGNFPLKQVVGELREGKSFYEVLNYFKIVSTGQRDITVSGNINGQNIPVNQIKMTQSVTVKAPNLIGDLVMISLPLVNQSEVFYPSDIKQVAANQAATLMVPATTGNSLLSLVMPKTEASKIGGIRASDIESKLMNADGADGSMASLKVLFKQILQTFSGLRTNETDLTLGKNLNTGAGGISLTSHQVTEPTPIFLGLIPRPSVIDGQLKVSQPTLVDGVEPVATYVVLSEIVRTPRGEYVLEQKYRQWEIYKLGWSSEIDLLNVPEFSTEKSYRWEVLFMGRRTGHNSTPGEYFLDGVTHVTRNSFDF